MENASKALLIAGGILLSLLVISLLMLMTNIIGDVRRADEDRIAQEQLVRFNQRFEAYNRTLLNGQEVITVINMAIDNNTRREVDEEGNPLFVNIVVHTNRDFIGETREVEVRSDGSRIIGDVNRTVGVGGGSLTRRRVELSRRNPADEWAMDQDVINFFNARNLRNPAREFLGEDSVTMNRSYRYFTIALNEFKGEAFEAMEIAYGDTGRVTRLVFQQR
ncbi:MAG: hypothetical protein FWC68_00385 [Oscillospiraceae bacterium]|nr:hypothetical protein [Oscillospiraceae bacterium]